ncbi:MAG TPA: HAMP domain-containing sensor histidine kinase [Verrucomicrobiae bacterium]|nr:HAMP domain-containing sensor histidine kinase [Verrucomicrobiae bacterium]
MIDLFLEVFTIAAVVILILGTFGSNVYNRLSTRITALIFASGPIALIIFVALNTLIRGTRIPPMLRLVEILMIILSGPIVLGLLAARFVRRPLNLFSKAIASLEQNNYRIQLQPTGIREFDEVFKEFNNLTERLQQEEKLRKDLVSDTSHELNTPLAIMIGQLTAVQEGKYKMSKERVDILKEQAERLEGLVQQLATYTRARIPNTDEPENILLKQLCAELIKRFSLELKQKGITPELHIAEDYMLHANSTVVQQILTNLIQNTLRYSEATELAITATPHDLTFSDNGRGVPSEALPYLFERFYRVDKSRSRKTGGLGLGLAIVKELAESQGWEINALAGNPGLTFVLKLATP